MLGLVEYGSRTLRTGAKSMASTLIIKDPRTGYEYAYESVSYRDPVTKKPKSKRTYLGRVDPVTREILPKFQNGKRNRTRFKSDDNNLNTKENDTAKIKNEALEKELVILHSQINTKDAIVHKIKTLISEYDDVNNDQQLA